MSDTKQPTPCTCNACPGASCTCGCQGKAAVPATPANSAVCACGPQCLCGPNCICARS